VGIDGPYSEQFVASPVYSEKDRPGLITGGFPAHTSWRFARMAPAMGPGPYRLVRPTMGGRAYRAVAES
jgi:hypothetical protein